MSRRALGLLAAGIAGACALLLGVVASAAGSGVPSEIPRGVILASLLGAPAAIGALGAVSGRRVLLVAAGILCLCLSVLSFSGVTLILLLPALLFLRASVSDPAVPLPRKPSSRRRLLVLVALAVPVALLAITRLGIFGLLPLVALGGLAAGLGRNGAFRPRPQDALIGVVVVGLVIGATFAAFTLTQTICWDDYGGGNVVVRVLPDMPTEQSSVAPFGGGCSSGESTVAGAALAGILLSGALGISGLSARVSRP